MSLVKLIIFRNRLRRETHRPPGAPLRPKIRRLESRAMTSLLRMNFSGICPEYEWASYIRRERTLCVAQVVCKSTYLLRRRARVWKCISKFPIPEKRTTLTPNGHEICATYSLRIFSRPINNLYMTSYYSYADTNNSLI